MAFFPSTTNGSTGGHVAPWKTFASLESGRNVNMYSALSTSL